MRVHMSLDDERRWEDIEAAVARVPDGEHAWEGDPASRGATLAQADYLIAAATSTIGARLATGSPKDFPMAEVQFEHWPAGG